MDNVSLFFFIYNLSHRYPFLDSLMVFGADYLIYFVFAIIIIGFSKGRTLERKAFFLSAASLLVMLIFVKTIRIFIQEPRPFTTYPLNPLIGEIKDLSFPSVHTATTAAIAFSYAFLKSKLTPFFIFSLIWIGFARIYTGVHYPLDILGGIIVGLAAASLAHQLSKYLHHWNA